MIAFGFNIFYPDESSLNDDVFDSFKETFRISKYAEPLLTDELGEWSDYFPLSGRRSRYCTSMKEIDDLVHSTWAVEIEDVVTFVWRCDDREIQYIRHSLFTAELLQFWSLHTILPLVLTLQKFYSILHVGAVEIDGSAILFSAESFGGKSTMTGFFLDRGHRLLSDDTLGVYVEGENVMAVASYPFHRPYRQAEALGQRYADIPGDPLPVKAVFVLVKSDPDAEIGIVELSGVDKYKALHMSTFINMPFMKKEQFRELGDLAKRTPA